ncbi:MAG: hypothetical protein Q7J35_08690 [Candidatus Methanoperedens sp.]|nr:hypothetical protein [Candidatus Methanoperedens sp.]
MGNKHSYHHPLPITKKPPSAMSSVREIPRKIEGIDKVEVIVIDDGSRDRTDEGAGNYSIIILK